MVITSIVNRQIRDQAVTYNKVQDVGANAVLARANSASGVLGEVALNASQLLGRGSTGDIAPISLGTSLAITGTTFNVATVTSGSVLFGGATGLPAQDNTNFFWDDTNNRLGIGTNSPAYTLHIQAGNVFMQSANEQAIIMQRTGTFTSGNNPVFSFGRIIDNGAKNVLRFLYDDDTDNERAIFNMDDEGQLTSTRPNTGPYFSGFTEGDTHPYFRVTSTTSPRIELGPGGSTAPDIQLIRSGTTTFQVATSSTPRLQVTTTATSALTEEVTNSALTRTNSAEIKRVLHKWTWQNSDITQLSGTSGGVVVCNLPARTIVTRAIMVVTGQASGPATLTASVGRTASSYIDYIVASDIKVAANTVYGDAVGEVGSNLSSYIGDLPSYTGTTNVHIQFTSTAGNLSTVTGSSGIVYLETMILP